MSKPQPLNDFDDLAALRKLRALLYLENQASLPRSTFRHVPLFPSVFDMVCKHTGLRGSRQEVYRDFGRYIAERAQGLTSGPWPDSKASQIQSLFDTSEDSEDS